VRNSSLVKRSCADNSTGLKPGPDAAGVPRKRGAVGEHSALGGRPTARTAGRGGSDDAGTSSDQVGENPTRRKPKGSWGRFIRPGLVGPKPRPRGVGEGQSVNIPIPPLWRSTDGVTQKGRHRRSVDMDVPEAEGAPTGKSVGATTLRWWGGLRAVNGPISHCRENPLGRHRGARTANRHRWARRESSGARENSREGTRQNDPVTSGEGVPR
jgi:hypothetical protein